MAVPELGPIQNVLYNQGFEQFKFDGVVTHETMFRELSDGTVEGMLVENWSVDPSGKVYTLNLRKGAKWLLSESPAIRTSILPRQGRRRYLTQTFVYSSISKRQDCRPLFLPQSSARSQAASRIR